MVEQEDIEDLRIDIDNRLRAKKKFFKQIKALRVWRSEMESRCVFDPERGPQRAHQRVCMYVSQG